MTVPSMDDVFDLEAPGGDVVVDTRLSLLSAAVDGAHSLGRFTDEELAALDGAGDSPLAPSPWFSSLTDDEQQIALTAALRGLTARGVYEAVPLDAETGEFAFRAAPELLALLTMRRWTDAVIVAERRLAERTDWAVLYRQRAALWLTEYVSHVGQHEFVLSTDADLADALTLWCGARADVAAPEFEVSLTREQISAQDASLEPVTQSTAAITITKFDIGESVVETWSGVFTGPQGSFMSIAVDNATRVSYRGADRDAVRDHWLTTLGAV